MPGSGDDKTSANDTQTDPANTPPPYSKPKLRRYDQIDQVKPYGPSERKAG